MTPEQTERIKLLVEKFARHVEAQTDEIARGDATEGNKHARAYIAAFKEIRTLGDEARDALAELFKHPRIDVRVMSAAYLLRYRHKEARKVLKKCSKKKGLAAFGAEQCLERWKEGHWQLDPEE